MVASANGGGSPQRFEEDGAAVEVSRQVGDVRNALRQLDDPRAMLTEQLAKPSRGIATRVVGVEGEKDARLSSKRSRDLLHPLRAECRHCGQSPTGQRQPVVRVPR